MKKIIAAILAFISMLLLVSCELAGSDLSSPSTESDEPAISVSNGESGEPELKEKISVVVLGDSIARGYGLEDVENQRFSAVLSQKLLGNYKNVNVYNYGIDGQTGAELQTMLETEPPAEINGCDVVIISIGGNNVLGSLGNLLGGIEGIENIDQQVFSDYLSYILANESEDVSQYEYSVKVLNDLLEAIDLAFRSEEFKNLVKTAGENLVKELPEIIKAIKELNPETEIYVQTVYNPYKGLNLSLKGIEASVPLSEYGDEAVKPLNDAIESLDEECGYKIAPVYDTFEASESLLTNAGINLLTGTVNVDPHPDANGHTVIAELYYKLLTEQ